MQVNADFDPLIAKLIVHRPTLDEVSCCLLPAEGPCQTRHGTFHCLVPEQSSRIADTHSLQALKACKKSLSQFHICGPGLSTNLPELSALVDLPQVRGHCPGNELSLGWCRTCLWITWYVARCLKPDILFKSDGFHIRLDVRV